jgi:hypothetical protein
MITQAVKQTISSRRPNIFPVDLRATGVVKVVPLLVYWILTIRGIVPATDTAKMVAHCETIIDQF